MTMNGTTYNQLIIFHAIAANGSVSGAARALEMTAPSVSNGLKQLENNLGVPLFTRTTRRVELTAAGEQLRLQSREPMAQLGSAINEIRNLSDTPSGAVRLTLPRFVYQLYLQPIYPKFVAHYPEVQLEISISDATVNLMELGLDLGIRFGDKIEPGMVARKLTPTAKQALFASPKYLNQNGMPNTPEQLQQHRLIQYRFLTANKLAPLELERDGQRLQVTMDTAMVVNDTEMLLDAASNGIGIGSLIDTLAQPLFDSGKLVPILEEHWVPIPPLYLYFHQHSQKEKRVRVLIDFLLAELRGAV